MTDFSTIVSFGLPETQVDDLIEATRVTRFRAAKWIVYGVNTSRLGGLVALWSGEVDITPVLVPDLSFDALDAALLIVENEGASASNLLWLHGKQLGGALPSGTRSALLGRTFAAERFEALLQHLSSDPTGPR
jgi:hypothetical protein